MGLRHSGYYGLLELFSQDYEELQNETVHTMDY